MQSFDSLLIEIHLTHFVLELAEINITLLQLANILFRCQQVLQGWLGANRLTLLWRHYQYVEIIRLG
jgi:hypothetical protein